MDHVSRVGLFLEVVKQQSFAGAARQLGMTGPAITKQVQALEQQLGVRLLHRTTRQVTLTEEGALYSERARKALDDLQEAEYQIQDLTLRPTGLLKVNVPMSFGAQYLAKPIAAFAQQYSQVRLEVEFDDRWVDVIGEGYDVVVRIGSLEDSSLVARQLARCPILLCATPHWLQQHGLPASPERLKNLPAIVYSKQDNLAEWRYQSPAGVVGSVSLKRNFSANNAEMMLQACLQHLGVALLPIFTVFPYLSSGQLVQILPEYSTYPERNIYAMFPHNRYLSTKTRLFVECLLHSCKTLPW